jgi:type II secretory pathway pseudopilin PulG
MRQRYFQKQSYNEPAAFTLIEILTVLTLSAMIMASTLLIYGRVRTSSAAIEARLDKDRLAQELLQKIAEDIDRLAAPGFDSVVNIANKTANTYNSGRLLIESRYYDSANKPQIFERIIWQSSYDPMNDSLILYRAHTGLNLEDKIVDVQRDGQSKEELFVPACPGLTRFSLEVIGGGQAQPLSQWVSSKLPNAVRIGVSFAPLEQMPDGSYILPEDKIFYRTVAVDRTRTIAYKFVPRNFDLQTDPNAIAEPNSLSGFQNSLTRSKQTEQ